MLQPHALRAASPEAGMNLLIKTEPWKQEFFRNVSSRLLAGEALITEDVAELLHNPIHPGRVDWALAGRVLGTNRAATIMNGLAVDLRRTRLTNDNARSRITYWNGNLEPEDVSIAATYKRACNWTEPLTEWQNRRLSVVIDDWLTAAYESPSSVRSTEQQPETRRHRVWVNPVLSQNLNEAMAAEGISAYKRLPTCRQKFYDFIGDRLKSGEVLILDDIEKALVMSDNADVSRLHARQLVKTRRTSAILLSKAVELTTIHFDRSPTLYDNLVPPADTTYKQAIMNLCGIEYNPATATHEREIAITNVTAPWLEAATQLHARAKIRYPN